MKRILSGAVILSLLLAVGGATRRAEASAAPQLLPGILSKMERAHQGLQSLKAGIVQQKVNTQINTKDTDYGTLLYKPAANGKGRMRIDYTRPDARVFSVIGESVVFYQPRINQALKTTVAKASKGRTGGYSQLVGLDSSVKTLAGKFNIELLRDEAIDGKMATQLRLVPKGAGESFTSLELWVDTGSSLPVQYKFHERNGDYTIVKLTNLEPNVKLADDLFVVKYPSGTKVVDKI